MSDLIQTLTEKPQGFDLFQALSLLERAQPERRPIGTSIGLDETVRLAAHVEMSFAASDIAGIDDSKQAGPPLTLRSSALSLAGPQGPLPTPFTELLLERRRAGDKAGLEFLDIFNQRLLAFLYRGRRKHHVALHGEHLDEEAALLRCLDALSGLGRAEGARGPSGERAWLRHAGLQGAAPRSLASLLALLRDRMGIRFQGVQFDGGWHALADSERASLRTRGRNRMRLGAGGSLGQRAWDQEAGLQLSTPSLPHAKFASLLPGGKGHALLGWLAARHLQRDVKVVLSTGVIDPPPSTLAKDAALPPRLGLSAWLSSAPRPKGDAAHPRWAPQHPKFVLRTQPAGETEEADKATEAGENRVTDARTTHGN
ncbi:type VI secretion system baseplate subunit TssG [Ramlibacter sp.]|uniref:type VI secretion system baseplate subunit TssG n=1 Tax=Ramlibacter sp. TaxID=1917967 RepID=UPI003D138F9A